MGHALQVSSRGQSAVRRQGIQLSEYRRPRTVANLAVMSEFTPEPPTYLFNFVICQNAIYPPADLVMTSIRLPNKQVRWRHHPVDDHFHLNHHDRRSDAEHRHFSWPDHPGKQPHNNSRTASTRRRQPCVQEFDRSCGREWYWSANPPAIHGLPDDPAVAKSNGLPIWRRATRIVLR